MQTSLSLFYTLCLLPCSANIRGKQSFSHFHPSTIPKLEDLPQLKKNTWNFKCGTGSKSVRDGNLVLLLKNMHSFGQLWCVLTELLAVRISMHFKTCKYIRIFCATRTGIHNSLWNTEQRGTKKRWHKQLNYKNICKMIGRQEFERE